MHWLMPRFTLAFRAARRSGTSCRKKTPSIRMKRRALEMAFAMHQASRIAEGIVSEEVVEDEEAASRRRQEAFNNYSHLAERALRSWLGGKLTSRDLHVWSQGYDAALHTLSVGGGRD
jgi:hypothetical protein